MHVHPPSQLAKLVEMSKNKNVKQHHTQYVQMTDAIPEEFYLIRTLEKLSLTNLIFVEAPIRAFTTRCAAARAH